MENAVDVWNDHNERFSQGDLVRISELMQEIYAMRQESKSATEFYSDLKILWEELEIYIPIPTFSCRYQCSCDAMRNARRNHTLLYAVRFLTGLNENFNVVKSQILLLDPLPPLNKIFSMVLQHERQGNFAISDDSKTLINSADSRGKASSNSSGRSPGSGNNAKGTRICSYCGQNNHTVENCYAKHGFPPHMQKRSVNNASSSENLGDEAITHDDAKGSGSHTFTTAQYEQLLQLLQHSSLNQSSPASSNQVQSTSSIGPSPTGKLNTSFIFSISCQNTALGS
jgi:hypothetical protein